MRFSRLTARLTQWARLLKRDVHALYLAAHDPRVPWYAKAAAIAVAAYALSPIDLIPDFIPILGYLDDLVLVPVGILLVARLVPSHLMTEFRTAAVSAAGEHMLGRRGAAAVVVLWIVGAIVAASWLSSCVAAAAPPAPSTSTKIAGSAWQGHDRLS